MDVRLVEAELTLAHVNPAMESLRELATKSRVDALALAETVGRDLRALANAVA